MSDDTYTLRILQRIDDLASRYHEHADEDTKTLITNLTGIYARLSDVVAAQAREIDHWARAARDAEEERDEMRVRAETAEADLGAALETIETACQPHGLGGGL